jgi:NitT/TauT family transport system permease protein
MAHVLTPSSSTLAARKSGPLGGAGLERLGWAVVSLFTLVVIWALAASVMGSRHFPGPVLVFDVLVREAQTGNLWHNLGITLSRVLMAFVIAMIIGGVIGLVVGSYRTADKFFDSWLTLFLNLPALVIIALCYVWLGTTEVTAVTAVAISKIPNVAVQMREGARGLSKDLSEMAKVYGFGPWKTLRHVVLPQLAPFWAAAARSGLALVWKIVLVVEALGGHATGVGHQIHSAFQSYDVPVILAYALAFIVVIQIVELGILQPVQARVNRWRR